jgi:hypothetical protein
MRGRRFARCVERAGAALEAGSLDECRAAMEEARALFPDAPEIADLERGLSERQSQKPFDDNLEQVEQVELLDEPVTAVPMVADSFLGTPHTPLGTSRMPLPEQAGRGLGLVGATAAFIAVFGLIGYGLGQIYLSQRPHAVPSASSAARSDATAGVGPAQTPAAPVGSDRPGQNATVPPSPAPPVQREPSVPPVQRDASSHEDPSATKSRPAVSPSARVEQPRAAADAVTSRPLPERRVQDAPPSSRTMATGTRAAIERPEPAPRSALDVPERSKPASSATVDSPPSAVSAVATTGTTVPPLPEPPPPSAPVPAAVRSGVAPAARVDETPMIRTLLNRYEAAYNRLDAAAASSVWPGVNREALDRAFSGLVSQKVSLGLCDITVIGDIGGASCAGKARWEPRVGGGTRTADRHWKFDLRRGADGWRIEQVLVR